jgi:predicted MFS family arabinose efflux permease
LPHNAGTAENREFTLQNASRQLMALAIAISLGAAISLGITRFAYGLLLPSMRTDLGWSYALAGAMNTANAAGYFLGALICPWLMRRFGPALLLVAGSVFAGLFMLGSGFVTQTEGLLVQRLLAGIASALVFVAGGLLAARLGARDPLRSGLLLGLYYGGTGVGIVLSSLVVPLALDAAQQSVHGWRWAWWAMGALCLLFSLVLVWPARVMAAWAAPAPVAGQVAQTFRWRQFGFGLASYTLFGVGYIGYMTFVVALLRSQGRTSLEVTVFYALLGVAVMASSRIWARLLDRHSDGKPLALLNALLGVATLLPALTQAWPLVLLSGLLFGAVFLSVVASTTALVRHNLPHTAWAAGISAFTTVFAAGQIIGPTVVGWIADGVGGLERGLVFSALALWAGAALATQQRGLSGAT